jgi:hypothetical protein
MTADIGRAFERRENLHKPTEMASFECTVFSSSGGHSGRDKSTSLKFN